MKPEKAAPRRTQDRGALAIAGAGAVVLLLLAAAFMWVITYPRQSAQREAAIGGPFRLVSDEGSIVTEHSFPGKYLAVYFGYTACRDICPATLNTLTAALNRLGSKSPLVQPLFITLDPQRDTIAVLHRYVGGFSSRLIGLRGDAPELHRVSDEYRVVSLVHQERAEDSHYTIDHSSVIYLIAPDGTFVAPIPADASEMTMAQALSRAMGPVL